MDNMSSRLATLYSELNPDQRAILSDIVSRGIDSTYRLSTASIRKTLITAQKIFKRIEKTDDEVWEYFNLTKGTFIK